MNKKFQLLFLLVFGFSISHAQNADFTLKYNSSNNQYEVYVKADIDFPKFFVGGGSQISIVLPAEIEDQRLLVETVEGGPWLDNSQIYAPESCSGCDFHGIASNGSLISLKKGEEKLLFTFVVPSLEKEKSIRLFDNNKDSQSSDKGMAGGDFNNFFACALTLKNAYRKNYGNEKSLTGIIKTWAGFEVDLVNISNGSLTTTTDDIGLYQMDILENTTSKIIPEKNVQPLNGVNTLDIIKIRQHILNNSTFSQPEQWIAADVNNSGTISASDMLEIRQLILGNITNFKNNKSWRFVNASHQFDRASPLNGKFEETATVAQLADKETINFTAIKIGDVDATAIPNTIPAASPRNTNQTLTLTVDDTQLKTGDTYTITFSTDQFNTLQGYQLSLQLNELSIEKVKSHFGSKDNFGLSELKNGLITTSWNRTTPLSEQVPFTATLFQITIKAQRDGLLSELLELIAQPTTIEAYDLEGNTMDIKLEFNAPFGQKPFELFQNEPNPFKSETSIGFYLPEDSEIEMTFRDETGRILKTIKEKRKAGLNSLHFNKKDFVRGLILYQLDTKFGSQNRKMLHIE